MRTKIVLSTIAMVSVSMGLLAASITPASAWNFWRHHHNSPNYYYHQVPVVVEPSVGVGVGIGTVGVGAYWASPQPGWYWHPYADYSNHNKQWRDAHPYHPGPKGGIYLQF